MTEEEILKIKERLNKNDRFCSGNGIQITVLKPDYAEAEMPITTKNANALGILQGGAMFTLADFAFAGACTAKSGPDDGTVSVAMNASVSFIRPGTGTKARAVAKIINRGRQTCHCDVEVFNDSNKLLCKIAITGFIFDPKKGKNK